MTQRCCSCSCGNVDISNDFCKQRSLATRCLAKSAKSVSSAVMVAALALTIVAGRNLGAHVTVLALIVSAVMCIFAAYGTLAFGEFGELSLDVVSFNVSRERHRET